MTDQILRIYMYEIVLGLNCAEVVKEYLCGF